MAHGRQSDALVLWPRGRQCDVLSSSEMHWALWPMAVSLMHRFCGFMAVGVMCLALVRYVGLCGPWPSV